MKLRNLDHGFDLAVGDAGVTIRKGDKWALRRGEEFELVEQYSGDRPDEVVGKGVSLGYWVGPLCDVPANLLAIEHADGAKDWGICFEMMKAGYGDEFASDTEITAMIYLRLS